MNMSCNIAKNTHKDRCIDEFHVFYGTNIYWSLHVISLLNRHFSRVWQCEMQYVPFQEIARFLGLVQTALLFAVFQSQTTLAKDVRGGRKCKHVNTNIITVTFCLNRAKIKNKQVLYFLPAKRTNHATSMQPNCQNPYPYQTIRNHVRCIRRVDSHTWQRHLFQCQRWRLYNCGAVRTRGAWSALLQHVGACHFRPHMLSPHASQSDFQHGPTCHTNTHCECWTTITPDSYERIV